jgi:hypothetical protein
MPRKQASNPIERRMGVIMARRVELLIGLVGAACPQFDPAFAANWLPVIDARDGTQVFIDMTSIRKLLEIPIRRPLAVKQVWVKYYYSAVKSEPARHSISQQNFNCYDRTTLATSFTSYRANGTVLRSWTQDDYSFRYEATIPGSIGEAIRAAECG